MHYCIVQTACSFKQNLQAACHTSQLPMPLYKLKANPSTSNNMSETFCMKHETKVAMMSLFILICDTHPTFMTDMGVTSKSGTDVTNK